MSSEELKEQIKEMLVTNLMLRTPKEEISNDLPLFGVDGLGLDSIDALQLVVSMEKTFGVGVPNSDVARVALATVNTIHDYIVEQGGGTRNAPDGVYKRNGSHSEYLAGYFATTTPHLRTPNAEPPNAETPNVLTRLSPFD